MIYSKIQRLSELVNRHRIKAVQYGDIFETFMMDQHMKDIETREPAMLKLIADSKAVFKDPGLNTIGQRRELEKLQRAAREDAEKASKVATLTEGVKSLEKAADGAVKAERDKHKVNPPSIVSVAQDQEIRQYVKALDKDAEKEKAAWLKEAEEAGKPISDQERHQMEQPSIKLYLEACQDYGPEKERFLNALDSAPWPLGIDADTMAAGQQILRGVIAPAHVEELRKGEMRLAFHEDLEKLTSDIIQAPAKVGVFSDGPTKLQPDEPHTIVV